MFLHLVLVKRVISKFIPTLKRKHQGTYLSEDDRLKDYQSVMLLIDYHREGYY